MSFMLYPILPSKSTMRCGQSVLSVIGLCHDKSDYGIVTIPRSYWDDVEP